MSTARSSVIPDLIDALVAAGGLLGLDLTVTDGLPTVANSGTYLSVGVDDPGVTRAATSARSTTEWAGAALVNGLNEAGEVTCAAWSQRGDSDARQARDEVFVVHAALMAYVRSHVGLGVPGVWDTRVGGADEFSQNQTEYGAIAVLRFAVAFKARI